MTYQPDCDEIIDHVDGVIKARSFRPECEFCSTASILKLRKFAIHHYFSSRPANHQHFQQSILEPQLPLFLHCERIKSSRLMTLNTARDPFHLPFCPRNIARDAPLCTHKLRLEGGGGGGGGVSCTRLTLHVLATGDRRVSLQLRVFSVALISSL